MDKYNTKFLPTSKIKKCPDFDKILTCRTTFNALSHGMFHRKKYLILKFQQQYANEIIGQ